MIGVGVIGLGVGMKHAEAVASHPGCRLACLCDLDPKKLALAGDRFPQARRTMDAEELLDSPDIDLVSIASYDDVHYDQAMRAIAAGKHVFVEKPLCQTRAQAHDLAQALADSGLGMSSNLVLRACPRFERLRQDIAAGRFGQVFHLEADYLWGRVLKLTHGWRGRMARYSIVQGAAVHMIDLVMWLADARPVEVRAVGSRLATSDAGGRFDDMAVLLLTFPGGLVAKVGAIAGCVHPHFHRLAVFGTGATFIQEPWGAKLFSQGDQDGPRDVLEPYPGDGKGSIITSFVDALLGKAASAIVPAGDVFDAMSVCFAADESISSGLPATVEYFRISDTHTKVLP